MSKVERIGVSIESELLSEFDNIIKQQGYQSRSEAFRDLIRQQLSRETLKNPETLAVAAVTLVYDHHNSKVTQKLTALQHNHLLETICSTHIHISHHDCMEIVVLKGRVSNIQNLADNILSLNGVKMGKVNMVAMEH